MFEYIIKTSPLGRQQYVHSHSHRHYDSHHRHHRRPRCHESCAGVSVEQWDFLHDENKELRISNDALTRENQSLKSDLKSATQENTRLVACNQALSDEVDGLRRSNSHDSMNSERFRRRIAALKTEVDNKERAVHHLEKENGNLATRVSVITDTVSVLTDTVSNLERKITNLKDAVFDFRTLYERTKRLLSTRTRELEDSKALVEAQRRTLRRLDVPLPSKGGRRHSCN
ncbi:hypothetical protein F4804DRAFT_30485 [Jackrogersella minutella]|nr:hypothetical protein F4804DRAFT_30485 [Jackrogersella minutella]